MRGLYAILDVSTLERLAVDPIAFARAVVAARPAALQVRAKSLAPREIVDLLQAIGPTCRSAGVPLVCNDRPDLAAEGGADMVHLGREDPDIDAARRLAPDLKVGLSTHDLEELERALTLEPDYVAYGPVYPTSSKADTQPVVGIGGLRGARAVVDAFAARWRAAPLVAIGGIDLARAPEVAAFADCAAVIGDLVSSIPRENGGAAQDGQRWLVCVTERARALHLAFGGS